VRLWVQNPLGVCETYQYKEKIAFFFLMNNKNFIKNEKYTGCILQNTKEKIAFIMHLILNCLKMWSFLELMF
jgi:hypothetical protein